MSDLKLRYLSDEWLYMPELRHPGMNVRRLKISEAVSLIENVHKAPGGLIRTTLRVEGNRIREALISGDFSLFPRGKIVLIEQALIGCPLNKRDVLSRIMSVYSEHSLESPGVTPDDFAAALVSDSK
jgi:lipoate-protein ligase A